MASLSIAEPMRNWTAGAWHAPAAEYRPTLRLAVRIDAGGAIQSLDGHWPMGRTAYIGSSYYSLLAKVCDGNSGLIAAIRAGIRTVGDRPADTLSIEFP